MNREPTDYSIEDVQIYVAQANRMTLDQVMALDFPKPDYTDDEENPYWRIATVFEWLDSFHSAALVTEIAEAPDRFDELSSELFSLYGGDHEQE